ncbi:uncharacterized protein PHACADRAFT_202708 [Phanerochaete carnosa HHB-10118-sp]|uniref:Uncharacterized protein n=1 Tax=Phanerochaete carnosa (strain HHB-10118-sp) TaxID=650164 RepID=K5VP80_PHACS|nr:uncharacterized protein PHACADRAFT_202708 [Phanerochaete carnosa HHB-10118-sp]EKM48525.1 hypothetical protein PHACADRAFT_202708 [Phanerochaete carnosa HHB-10118-sp]
METKALDGVLPLPSGSGSGIGSNLCDLCGSSGILSPATLAVLAVSSAAAPSMPCVSSTRRARAVLGLVSTEPTSLSFTHLGLALHSQPKSSWHDPPVGAALLRLAEIRLKSCTRDSVVGLLLYRKRALTQRRLKLILEHMSFRAARQPAASGHRAGSSSVIDSAQPYENSSPDYSYHPAKLPLASLTTQRTRQRRPP